ncbi:MAG: hypothetical protein ACREP1_00010 [Rhodanobacteraceae bacterium]
MKRWPTFLAELKRRNVLREAVLYIGAIWALAQGISQLGPIFGAPDWLTHRFVIAAIIGFPIWCAFGWFYELTPQGFKRESEVASGGSIAHLTGRKLDFWIIGILGVAVVLLATNTFVPRRAGSDADANGVLAALAKVPAKSVAVLPLVNESGDPRQDYFSDGLSEELISVLGQVRDLKVIGRNSSFQFRGKQQNDAAGIAAKLGVATLLEGSVRKQGDRVRIVASLIKAADGSQLWSQSYDRESRDVFAVQSDIATSVARALQAVLLGEPRHQLKPDAPPSGSVEAYNALLQGNFHLDRHTADDLRMAARFYRRAVALDPAYAYAWARLSMADVTLASNFPQTLSRDELASVAAAGRIAVANALRLDPDSAEAHLARGAVLDDLDLQPISAEVAFRRAAQLAPHNPDAVRRLAALNAELGRFDLAVAGYRIAIGLDPLSARPQNDLSISLVSLGAYAEAEAAERKAIALRPQGGFQHAWLAGTQMLQGRTAQAIATAQQEADPAWRTWALALSFWADGNRKQADAALQKLIAEDADDSGSQIAEVYAQRGQPDQMFRWLEHAYATHDGGVVEILISPFFTLYKDDPRFAAFARKVGVMAPVSAANISPANRAAQRTSAAGARQ